MKKPYPSRAKRLLATCEILDKDGALTFQRRGQAIAFYAYGVFGWTCVWGHSTNHHNVRMAGYLWLKQHEATP